MTNLLDRDEAIRHLCDRYLERDSFLVLPPMENRGPTRVARALEDLDGSVYIDKGNPQVMWGPIARAADTIFAMIDEFEVGVSAVFVVPKTVPAPDLQSALGNFGGTIPVDGSQDIIGLTSDDNYCTYPQLFVQMLEIVDPKAAVQIRANDLGNLS